MVWPGNRGPSENVDGEGGLPGSELPPTDRATGAVPELLPARQPLNLDTACKSRWDYETCYSHSCAQRPSMHLWVVFYTAT